MTVGIGDTRGDGASRNLREEPSEGAQVTREIAEREQLARSGDSPILYGVQGVAGSNPAVPINTTEAPYLSASSRDGDHSTHELALCRAPALGTDRGDSAHVSASFIPGLGLEVQYAGWSWLACARGPA